MRRSSLTPANIPAKPSLSGTGGKFRQLISPASKELTEKINTNRLKIQGDGFVFMMRDLL
jgi:hypothetical protein